MNQPFKFDKILYNEVIHWLQQEWQRELTDHEINVLVQGYRYGRYVEAKNEVRIVEVIHVGEGERKDSKVLLEKRI